MGVGYTCELLFLLLEMMRIKDESNKDEQRQARGEGYIMPRMARSELKYGEFRRLIISAM
jgi:hypothetical protein